ncbi:MAG: hypothetical protein NTX79_01730 [Candidatus Micrarchaeota archaeon]|nr:hypothetical protein [Candidatus Micrarchaeota archaeon]
MRKSAKRKEQRNPLVGAGDPFAFKKMNEVIPHSELDSIPFKLTGNEMEMLNYLLRIQRATTLGNIQRMVNAIRKIKNTDISKQIGADPPLIKNTDISWRKIKVVSKNLQKLNLIQIDAVHDDKKTKERVFLSSDFVSKWTERRLGLIKHCATFVPYLRPAAALGSTLAEFYRLEKLPPLGSKPNEMDKKLAVYAGDVDKERPW